MIIGCPCCVCARTKFTAPSGGALASVSERLPHLHSKALSTHLSEYTGTTSTTLVQPYCCTLRMRSLTHERGVWPRLSGAVSVQGVWQALWSEWISDWSPHWRMPPPPPLPLLSTTI